jgi:hypothetical protein
MKKEGMDYGYREFKNVSEFF